MLADSLLPISFWAEAVNTACYVLDRVLVTKPRNKTPYELLIGKSPSISFMRPFGYPLTILNTLDSLGKFDGKSDEGYLLGYSTSSKAFRVYNKRTKRVEENMHINFLEDQPNVTGTGPNWMFDLDFLTNSMNYIPVSVENHINMDEGTHDSYVVGSSGTDKGPTQEYILLPLYPHRTRIPVKDVVQDAQEQPSENASPDKGIQVSEDVFDKEGQHQMPEDEQVWQDELEMMVTQELVANAMNDESRQAFEEEKRRIASQKKAAQATSTNQLSTDRPFCNVDEYSFVYLGGKIPIDASTLPNADLPIDPNMPDLEDASDTLLNDGIFNGAYDDDEDVGAVADFNNMDNTIARVSNKREDSKGFFSTTSLEEPKTISQALKDESWVEAMQEELLQFKLQQVWILVDLPFGKKAIGTKWVFKTREMKISIVVKKSQNLWLKLFMVYIKLLEIDMRHALLSCWRMVLEEVKQQPDGIFISQDKYVADILKKFDFCSIKTATTRIESNKPLVKDEDGVEVDVHKCRSMIDSLMYLTASRPDIMFAVCACTRRLISWQCKKQTIVANSTTEAEYVAAAHCCGQVLWIQNQMMDYGFNFMNTKIHIDNESTICVVKNPVYHSRTKHIEIRHHFIRDCYEKRLIDVLKIHTDSNVADLLTKGFDVTSKLQLADATGIHNLSDAEIYAGLATLGYVTEGDIVPLLPAMLAGAAVDQGEGSAQPAEPHHTPVDPISSTSQPPIPSPHPSPHPSPLHHSPPHSPLQSPPHSPPQSPPHLSPPRSYEAPLPEGNTSGSAEDSMQLKELMVLVPTLVTRINSLEKELKDTKQTLGNAVLKLVKKVKSLEKALKRKSKKVLISESEGEEPEDQGRKIQDIDDDPLVSLVRESMKEKSTDFVTPTKASGEAQEEEISPTILEAAKTLSKVASQGVSKEKSTDKGKRYRRKARSMAKKIDTGLDAEEEINTGREEINTGIEEVSTGSTKVDSGTASKRGQREGKAPMVEEDIQATHKTKEQMRQEEAGLEEAIKLQAQLDEEVAKQIHLDKMIAKRMAEEEALTEQQKKRKAQVQFEAQFYTEEDWDAIRAKLEANAELSKDVLGKDLPKQDFAKRMAEMFEDQEKFDKLVQQIDTFVPINLEATKAKLKIYGEELQTKTLKKQKIDDKDVPAIGEKVAEVKEEEQVKRTGKRKKQKARKGICIDPPLIEMLLELTNSNKYRKYPLSKEACQVMLKMKLLDGKMNEVCYKLLKMIEKQAEIRK
ncbi:ribonuclease H-like domain-containing protein [Tanacetum coccineum]|uniref:Ribonuclease H-like domain-containing protein n=1 Tax=Tanacetum coccineum TaxID=301880 RepID=A0ABQ4YS90_9ASTR